MLTSLVLFSSKDTFSPKLFTLKIMSLHNLSFVPNRISSETSHKIPKWSRPQTLSQLARDLFILIASAIIWIYFRPSQPPISLRITAASPIRNTLNIILTNLLKRNLHFHQISSKDYLIQIFLLGRYFFLLLSVAVVVVVAIIVVVIEVVVVAVVAVIVLVVVVVVVVKFWPGLINTNWGP